MALITIGLSIVIGILTIFYIYMIRNFNYWKKLGIPHEKPVVFFGTMKECSLFQTSVGEYMAKVYKKSSGPYHGIFAFDKPFLLINNPEMVKNVLVKDFHYFRDRAILSDENVDPVGTYNLFNLKNPEWKTLRTKLSPVFSSGKMKIMFKLINDVGIELEKYITNISKVPSDSKEICIRYTTDVISSCALGINSNCLTDVEDNIFRNAGKKHFDITIKRGIEMSSYFFFPELVKIFRFKLFHPELSELLRKVLLDSIKYREEHKHVRNDLIDALIDLKKNDSVLNNENKLVAQVAVFFAAGFETSSTLMSFTLFELARNQEIQSKLREEILTALAKNNNEITYDILQEITYLDMVCSETLRKYPSLPFLDRRCMDDYKLPGTDIILGKGTAICIPLLGLHYDPKYFPNPEKYDPDRFSKENKQNIPFGAYLPFGEGPHNCIGARFGLMSAKVGLIHILSKFQVATCSRTPTSIKFDPKSFLVRATDDLVLDFKKIYT